MYNQETNEAIRSQLSAGLGDLSVWIKAILMVIGTSLQTLRTQGRKKWCEFQIASTKIGLMTKILIFNHAFVHKINSLGREKRYFP